MHILISNRTRFAFKLLTLAAFAGNLFGQYPGPAEGKDPSALASSAPNGWPQGPQGDLTPFEYIPLVPDPASSFPDAGEGGMPAQGAVSVAELQHPLSRKGRALLTKALNDLHAGKAAEGLRDLTNALKEPSAVPYAHSLLGSTYLQLGFVPEAILELEQAVQLLPIAVNYSNLGYAHGMNGDAEQGEKELQRALELNPSSPQTHYLIGLLLLDSKSRTHEACEQLQWAQRTMQSAHVALAVCYVRGGWEDAADRQVKAFVGSGDDSHLAYWKRWVKWVAAESRPSLVFGFHPSSLN